MFEHVVMFLHQKDRSILTELVYGAGNNSDLANYVSSDKTALRSALRIDEGIYIEKNTSTASKISILRRLFALYQIDPMDLVFHLRDPESEKTAEANRFSIRKKYWAYALPALQSQHAQRGTFRNASPSTSNTIAGFFGIGGFCICCIANYDQARIDFYLGKSDVAQNKAAYDAIYKHKAEIEAKLGVSLTWEHADQYKASSISYHLYDVSVTNESDWPRMAKFHAEWSDKLCNAILPYLKDGVCDE